MFCRSRFIRNQSSASLAVDVTMLHATAIRHYRCWSLWRPKWLHPVGLHAIGGAGFENERDGRHFPSATALRPITIWGVVALGSKPRCRGRGAVIELRCAHRQELDVVSRRTLSRRDPALWRAPVASSSGGASQTGASRLPGLHGQGLPRRPVLGAAPYRLRRAAGDTVIPPKKAST